MPCPMLSRFTGFLVFPVSVFLVLGGACDPYGTYDDPAVGLGPVDPVTFPAANIGTGGDRKRPGRGIFAETRAFAAGESIGYFGYAVPSMGVPDPLRVVEDDKPYARVPTPTAIVFDPDAGKPIPDKYLCSPPPNYSFDRRRDEVRYDEQGNIFTALPVATYAEGMMSTSSYVPVVAETTMPSRGLSCQQLKSEKQFETKGLPKPSPSGKYLAWLVIDPAAAVYPKEDPTGMMHGGIGLQRWGWYGRYLLAYLDGGYIPTEEKMVSEGPMAMPVMRKVKRMVPQKLFIPRTVLRTAGAMPTPGQAGAGYDVLEAKLGDPGYSPLCELWTYETSPGMGMPPLPIADLPKDAKTITDTYLPPALAVAPAASRYTYCLQVR